jgi:integrase
VATLEFINYIPHWPEISHGHINWVANSNVRTITRLPQIFWDDGNPWREVNLWALEMGRNNELKLSTAISVMEHLHKYAEWLEQKQVDWRHFPVTKSERVLLLYRGDLIDARDRGILKPSTTTARMNAVIRFYRFAVSRNFISHEAPMWKEKSHVVRYINIEGLERTMNSVTTDLSIPNRIRKGLRLENGLLPLTENQKKELLLFASKKTSQELYLMLLIGFYTGARLGTILSLRTNELENAVIDSKLPNMWLIKIGPGTGINTKFDITGELMISSPLMSILRTYWYSRRHFDRVIKANNEYKNYLFLTRFNKPYSIGAIQREMVVFRRAGQANGLKFLQTFKFHQTRATFGTWLMKICLSTMSVKAAIEYVKLAMHHKHESTTFNYITFIENTKEKIEIQKSFTESFLELSSRMK